MITVQPAAVAAVQVTPGSGTLFVGQSAQLTATIRDADGNTLSDRTVAWTSSDLSVLSGTTNGNNATVTAVAPGTATVTASVAGVSGTATFTVTSPPTATVASVDFAPSSVTLDVGQTMTVTATVRDAAGSPIPSKVVHWLSTDAAVVGGTTNGNSATLQGVGAGSATVTADVDGVVGNLPVTVNATAPQPVASATISPPSATIVVGTSLILVATLRDANGNVLTGRTTSWSSSNLAVAGGSFSGNVAVIQGVSVGVATITVTSEGVSANTLVTVIASAGTIPLTCAGVAGGQIYAQNGQYLGRLTNVFDSQSVLNTFGVYGSQFSATSMYNPYSQYGSQFALYSAYNQSSISPPVLYVSGRFAAYVTKNTVKIPRVDPDALKSCVFP